MRTQTVLIIVATGILVVSTVIWWLVINLTSDIIETGDMIDSMRIESEKAWRKLQDSTPTFDSTDFIFVTDTPDPNSYILKGDTSNPNIYLSPPTGK